MITSGTYVITGELRCWKEFALYVDAIDGHVSTWLARGESRKEG